MTLAMGAITISVDEDGSALDVWVVLRAHRSELRGEYAGALWVRVAEPAEGGRANQAAMVLLKKISGATEVYLENGFRFRRKRVVFVGVTPEDLQLRID